MKNEPIIIDDLAPTGDKVTERDVSLLSIYTRILDLESGNTDWQDITRNFLQIDPDKELDEARLRYESFHDRAVWMVEEGRHQLSNETDPTEMFKSWATSILITLIKTEKLNVAHVEGSGLEIWGRDTIDDLVGKGQLLPDPEMSPSECAMKIRQLLKGC